MFLATRCAVGYRPARNAKTTRPPRSQLASPILPIAHPARTTTGNPQETVLSHPFASAGLEIDGVLEIFELGESARSGLAGCVVAKHLLRKSIKLSIANITLDLVVPSRPVEFQEPGAKLRKLLGGERLNLLLDVLDLAHDLQPAGPV